MMARIKRLVKGYKGEMMDLNWLNFNFELVSKNHQIILVDLIPPFLNPIIKCFDFNQFENEDEMLESIRTTIREFNRENWDPEETLVIQLIHKIDNYL
jgi:hypothetical protein